MCCNLFLTEELRDWTLKTQSWSLTELAVKKQVKFPYSVTDSASCQ